MLFDPLILSRLQFGFVVSFHILFPAFTIGLASWLAVLEIRWVRSGRDVFRRLYDFWIRIFALSFGLGVVSGIVMTYQFGTNWSGLTMAAGNVLGPVLSYEVLTAFFLEAGFLGIMLFGRDRVSRGAHLAATVVVAVGTLLSAFWILSGNSWLHTPAGYQQVNGVFRVTDWWAVIFNRSFPFRLLHMVLAAYLTTSFVVAGVGAFYLFRGRATEEARIMVSMATALIVILIPIQIWAGDSSGLLIRQTQPAKLAAIEGHWESGGPMPLVLFGIPDEATESNLWPVEIPHLGSLIVTRSWEGGITGLDAFARDDRPPVFIVFWSFRVMVGLGMLMLLAGTVGLYLRWRGRLYDTRWFQYGLMAMMPSGFAAVLAGWFTTEIGRQPYTVYGLLRTENSMSPVDGGSVALSLALFVLFYATIYGAGTFYLLRAIARGPERGGPAEGHDADTVMARTVGRPTADLMPKQGAAR
jgi:cytochrome d ubiquinol oxidase subunit I